MIVKTTLPATPPQTGAIKPKLNIASAMDTAATSDAGCKIANGELSKLHIAAKQAGNRSREWYEQETQRRDRDPFPQTFLLEQL